MLTVDYDRLGLRAGELLLDLGAGNGRHAFEALRRGARVVACDYDHGELVECNAICAAMFDQDEVPDGGVAASVNADAVHLPYPDATFDRIIAAEVLEHIPDDRGALNELARVLKPGGTIAVTVPAWLAETVCWKLNDEYHAPKAIGGHVRIYTEGELREKMSDEGLRAQGSHHAHALHSPYWWLKCAVGIDNDDHPLVKAYHRLLVWDMTDQPLATRLAERALQPVMGKSIVLYAGKSAHPPVAPMTPSTSLESHDAAA